jgi:hypothetical protein
VQEETENNPHRINHRELITKNDFSICETDVQEENKE